MRKIILSTESGADLPESLVEKYQIQVVPMHVVMDGKDYLDGELPVEDVFDYHSRTKKSHLLQQRMYMSIKSCLQKSEPTIPRASLFTLAIRQKHLRPFKVH